MADAMVSHAKGSEATFYNPAGLLSLSSEIAVMHKEWIQDTQTEFLGATASLDADQAIGISVNSTTVQDIEIRTRPGPAEGTFTARNYALGLSYSRVLSDHIRAGITGKFLYEKILIDEASGFGVDFGLQYETPIEHLSAGVVIANLGSMNNLRNEKTALPSLIRAGAAFESRLEEIGSDLTLASDYVFVFPESGSYASVGAELVFEEAFAARLGYTFGSEGRKLSTGIGLRYGILGLDYAYAPLAADLGNAHTISVLVRL